MTVKEVLQLYGSWEMYLRSYTPRDIIDTIQANPFGHIAIVPGRIDPAQYGDGLLALARYVGVFRAFFNQPDDQYEIKGTGLALWLGDEDDKGDVYETPITFTNQTFANTVRGLLPAGGAITEGTLFSVPPGTQLYTGTHQHQSPRKAITYVTDTFSTDSQPVEWRINGDGTLDAGPVASLYQTTPRAILVEKDAGRELALAGLQATLSNDYDVEDYTTRVVLLGEGEGGAIATGSADAPPTPYRDLHGNPVKMTRLISESVTSGVNANIRAAVELNRFADPRRAAQISTDEYDVKGDFNLGDYIYVFDPDGGFVDDTTEVFWRGVPINPMKLRVIEMTWPIRAEWTVAFRTNNGAWIDLSQYYRPETGATTIAVGDFLRTLAGGGGTEPVGSRPAADSSIPAAPVFGPFSTGNYQSGDNDWTKAAILATWSQPLNLDGSTVVDGDHYEIRYRVNAYKGYGIRWGLLSGYDLILNDLFTRTVANGWGPDWTTAGGASSEYAVDGARGVHAVNAVNSTRVTAHSTSLTSVRMVGSVEPSAVATGADIHAGMTFRRASDGSSHLRADVRFQTDGSYRFALARLGGAGGADLALLTNVGTYTPGQKFWVVVEAIGTSIKAKVWSGVREDEPGAWNIDLTETSITAGHCAIRTILTTGNTNALPYSLYFDDIEIIDMTNTGGYRWGELAGNRWGAPISAPVESTGEWHIVYVGWAQTQVLIQELTPGVEYEFQIRGVDGANPPNRGPFSASTFVVASGDLFAPSQPAAPVVASSMISIQVVHTLGKNSGGTFNLEPDLAYFSVHVGGSSSFYPDESNIVGKLVATAGMIQAHIPAVGTFQIEQTSGVWVKVVAVDQAGNRSAASVAVQATVDLIDDAHISDLTVSKVTAGTITAAWIMSGSIKTSDTGARVEIDAAGVRAYDSDGENTTNIEAATGDASITGEFKTSVDGAGVRVIPGAIPAIILQPNPADNHYGQIYGQYFIGENATEMGIRRTSDGAIDGGKFLALESGAIVSHQPNGGTEQYIGIGWPVAGNILARGKFPGGFVFNDSTFYTQGTVVGAGFGGIAMAYGPTMTGSIFPLYSISGAAANFNHCITVSSLTGYTVNWSDALAHNVWSWVCRA